MASVHLPAIQGGKWPFVSKYARMAFFEYASMEEKMPGIIAHGDFQLSLALIQKQRGQQSGRARIPRFLAEIRMQGVVRHWCFGGKMKKCQVEV